jgi:hypothetical protein
MNQRPVTNPAKAAPPQTIAINMVYEAALNAYASNIIWPGATFTARASLSMQQNRPSFYPLKYCIIFDISPRRTHINLARRKRPKFCKKINSYPVRNSLDTCKTQPYIAV